MVMDRGLGGFNYTYTVNSFMTLASVDRKIANTAGPPLTKSRYPTRTILIVDENTDPLKGYCTVNDAHFATGDSTCDRHPGPRDVSYDHMSRGVAQGVATVGYLDGHTGTVPGLVVWNSTTGQKLFWR
jgi:hypothetical protein